MDLDTHSLLLGISARWETGAAPWQRGRRHGVVRPSAWSILARYRNIESQGNSRGSTGREALDRRATES